MCRLIVLRGTNYVLFVFYKYIFFTYKEVLMLVGPTRQLGFDNGSKFPITGSTYLYPFAQFRAGYNQLVEGLPQNCVPDFC